MRDTHKNYNYTVKLSWPYKDQMKIHSDGNYWAHTANQTCDWLCHYGCEIMNHSPSHPDLAPCHLQLFKTLQKCLVKKICNKC
jgi:hypothetical protein